MVLPVVSLMQVTVMLEWGADGRWHSNDGSSVWNDKLGKWVAKIANSNRGGPLADSGILCVSSAFRPDLRHIRYK